MGAHAEHNEVLDPETRAYNDFMTAGKDFQKIELYAYAIKQYKDALSIKPNDKDANANIDVCRTRLSKDNKIIAVIAVVAVAAVGIFLLV